MITIWVLILAGAEIPEQSVLNLGQRKVKRFALTDSRNFLRIFQAIEEKNPAGRITITTTRPAGRVYDSSGRLVNNLHRGIFFVVAPDKGSVVRKKLQVIR